MVRKQGTSTAAPRLLLNLPPLKLRYSQTQGAKRVQSDCVAGEPSRQKEANTDTMK